MLSWSERSLRKGVKKRVIYLSPFSTGDGAALIASFVGRLRCAYLHFQLAMMLRSIAI
jgi:hypothetical protein